MNPERQAFIGILLITVLLTGWLLYMSIQQRPLPPQPTNSDTIESIPQQLHEAPKEQTQRFFLQDSVFAPHLARSEQIIVIESPLYKAYVSSRGGTIRRFFLKHYKTWDGHPVQLIPWEDTLGGFGITFLNPVGEEIDTRLLHFSLDAPMKLSPHLYLDSTDSLQITATLLLDNGGRIQKTFQFYGDRYTVGASVLLDGLQKHIRNFRYDITWNNLIKYQEWSSVDESAYSYAAISVAGDMEKLDAPDFDEPAQTSISGKIDFLAVKNKFFAIGILPMAPDEDATAFASGKAYPAPNEGRYERYNLRYRLPYREPVRKDNFLLYLGPLDYDIVEPLGLAKLIDLGWEWLVRPIGEYFTMPIFKLVHLVIPNYGFAIIIFSILIKLLLHPLSIQQIRSAEKMRLLQPEIEKIRKKYKEEPKLQQQEIMRLYQEYRINPAGGCLPMLIQLPILYSLYMLFNSFIELRQTPFILWITDLSIPDFVITFPFRIPLFNVDKLSGLAILMAIALFIQQKMTITDPRQKMMIYVLPILFLFLFSNFPSGLNLYYFTFNILGIAQQFYLRKFSKQKITLEDLKRQPGKESWLQRRLREMQQLAETQNRTLPGVKLPEQMQKKRGTKTKYQRKKKKKR